MVHLIGEGPLFGRLKELEAVQWWSADRVAALQAERLSDILNFAAGHARHYQGLLPPSGSVTAKSATAVLQSTPFLTKSDLQANAAALTASGVSGRVAYKTTGGSTGQAVTIAKDRRALAFERAAMWLGYGWSGIHFGDRCARFWGSQFSGSRRAVGRAGDFAMNRVRFSAFAFDDSDLERYWRRCVAFQPAYLYGYVSMLEAFASFVQRRGYDGRAIGARAVITTSEVLSPPQRDLLATVFGVRVAVEYGCGEVGPIAYECERGSLHIMSADLVLEVVDEAGHPSTSDQGGHIVITDLNSRAMPLIRYRIGDNGVLGDSCACGRGFPVLKKIWGRAYDVVQEPGGRRYHGEFFMYLFEDLRKAGEQIRQFQVVQDTADHLTILIVADPPTAANAAFRLTEVLGVKLPRMRVDITRVDEIERSPSGKMQVVRNLIAAAQTTA